VNETKHWPKLTTSSRKPTDESTRQPDNGDAVEAPNNVTDCASHDICSGSSAGVVSGRGHRVLGSSAGQQRHPVVKSVYYHLVPTFISPAHFPHSTPKHTRHPRLYIKKKFSHLSSQKYSKVEIVVLIK